jgi:hypothetical protein
MIYFEFDFSDAQDPAVLTLIEFLDFHFHYFRLLFIFSIPILDLRGLKIQLFDYF